MLAITIVGGLLIYSVFYSTSGTLSAKGQITVEAVDLVKDTNGNIAFTITLKNSGNKPLANVANALNVTLDGESPASIAEAANLQPGQSIAKMLSGTDLTQTYVVGNKYNVVISATFSDGSTFSTTTSVMCRMG